MARSVQIQGYRPPNLAYRPNLLSTNPPILLSTEYTGVVPPSPHSPRDPAHNFDPNFEGGIDPLGPPEPLRSRWFLRMFTFGCFCWPSWRRYVPTDRPRQPQMTPWMPKPVPKTTQKGPKIRQARPLRTSKPASSPSRDLENNVVCFRCYKFMNMAAFVHHHVASICQEAIHEHPKWPTGCPNRPPEQPKNAQHGPKLAAR